MPEFWKKFSPLIEDAARATERRARRVIADTHLLWLVYVRERDELLTEASRVREGKPNTKGETMTEEEFEQYLLNRAVWVPYSDEDLT